MFTVAVSHVHQKHKFSWEGLEGTSGGIYAAVYKNKNKKKIAITFKRLAGHIQKSTCWIFFPTYKFGINGLLPKSYFVLHAIKNGCVYASYRVEEYVHFLKFLKCHLWEVEEERDSFDTVQ